MTNKHRPAVRACRVLGLVTLGLISTARMAVAAGVLTVDWSATRQEMDGFGIAFPGAAMWIKNFTEPARTQILNTLFSTTNGAGFSIVRSEITADNHDATDFRVIGAGNLQPLINSHQPSEHDWNWTGDEAQVWLMQQAKRYGVTNFLSTVWSAPPWMKANGSYRGDITGPNGEPATLLTNKHQAFADYLSRYVREYKTRFGIDISAVSIVNEPGFAAPYQGMLMEAPQMVDLLKNYLKPTFVRDGVAARIMAPEEAHWQDTNRLDAILSDPGAKAAVDIIANHGYLDSTQALPEVKAAGKRLWMTEHSELTLNTNSMFEALRWAKNIHGHVTEAETQAWIWWYAAQPIIDGGPGSLVFLTYEAPLYTAQRDTFRYSKRLWAIGNYARFIRPGFVRVAITGTPAAGVYVSAFRATDGAQFVTVAVNDTDTAQPVELRISGGGNLTTLQPYTTSATMDLEPGAPVGLSGGAFVVTLPPRSVTSLVKASSPLPAAPLGDVWLSDLEWASASIAGIDPPQRDRTAVGAFWYGLPITISGTNHPKGLGFTAPSTIFYHLGGQGDRFTAVAAFTKVGISNAVRFQVWGDDTLLFDGTANATAPPLDINVSVRGRKILKLAGLSATPGGPFADDVGAWASARVTHAGPKLNTSVSGNSLVISLVANAGDTYVLERSTNLQAWAAIATNTATGSSLAFNVPASLADNAFFRAHKF